MPVLTSLFFSAVALTSSLLNAERLEQCAHLSINTEQHNGGIGIVNSTIIDEEKAKTLAKRLADVDLRKHQPVVSDDEISTFFYKKGIYQIAISTDDKSNIKQCRSMACDFKACEPSWLCQENRTNSDMVSVSFRSTSLKSQFSYLKKNLDEILSYLRSSNVAINERFLQIDDNSAVTRSAMMNNTVEMAGLEVSPSLINGFCFAANDSVFANFHIEPSRLLDDPNAMVGQGIVERLVASGLLSDKIELSIKRAMVDLAKQKKITVDVDVEVRQSADGYFKLTDVKNNGKVILSASLKSIDIIPTINNYSIQSSVIEI
ncbi:MAG: hypothetical protein V2I33_04520 [Kangiellaceae bacterium]|jgi:hypothetical protein|nr:hypothetical protein [Kangiellaceae bacterium]